MITFRSPKYALATVSLCFFIAGLRADEKQSVDVPIEPGALLKNITDSRRAYVNVRMKSLWTSRQPGIVTSESQEFFWDDLGRRRIITHVVPGADVKPSADNQRDCVTDTIYDGEIVSYSKSYPHLNRIGQDPNHPETKDKVAGYNPVIIGDASSSLRSSLEQERNPFEYVRNAVIPAMQEAVKRNKLSVSAIDSTGVIRAEITNEHIGTDGIAKSVIEAVPDRQWLVTSIKGYSSRGDCINDVTFSYRQQTDGLWVPLEGRHRIWNLDSPQTDPVIDWHCDVREASFNDPAFDASIFTITLKPDAAVSDTRYNITYRIGAEQANTAQMQGYVSDAMGAIDQKHPLGATGINIRPRSWAPVLLWGNAAVLLACAVAYIVTIARRRRIVT